MNTWMLKSYLCYMNQNLNLISNPPPPLFFLKLFQTGTKYFKFNLNIKELYCSILAASVVCSVWNCSLKFHRAF